jgi:hypothetical protein
MNLQEQIGALEASVDDLILAAAAAATAAAAQADSAAAAVAAPPGDRSDAAPVDAAAAGTAQHGADDDRAREQSDVADDAIATNTPDTADTQHAPDAKPTLHVERPSQNEIVLSVNGQTVSLHPLQLGQLIEELSNARASMQPEAPTNLPPGWRFVSTKNPMMAVQKQSNGDRLLVMRHTGHGWVPFTFSPDMVVQLYMMLTQR